MPSFVEKKTGKNFGSDRQKNRFSWGANPQTGGGNPSEEGGICSAQGVLQHGVEILATGSKTTEISTVKKNFSPNGEAEPRNGTKVQ